MIPTKEGKPLGGKSYGHIPHIPGSRMGPGDHHCHAGQAEIATVKTRDKNDLVTVTVKLDGSCMSVARLNGVILPLSRAGYLASTSKYEQHSLFSQWVYANQERFLTLLEDGERVVGEWMAQAHGTRYNLIHGPFVPFDIMVGAKRLLNEEVRSRVSSIDLPNPAMISSGPSLSLDLAISAISEPMHGELDPVEGAVWRIERKGQFDFLCKWVHPKKQDGKYLPEISGGNAIWNWKPFDV